MVKYEANLAEVLDELDAYYFSRIAIKQSLYTDFMIGAQYWKDSRLFAYIKGKTPAMPPLPKKSATSQNYWWYSPDYLEVRENKKLLENKDLYSTFSQRDKKYYFYWRACALDGEYLTAHTKYVLVLLEELLANPYTSSEAVQQITSHYDQLCTQYKDQLIGLDSDLIALRIVYSLMHNASVPLPARGNKDYYNMEGELLTNIWISRYHNGQEPELPVELINVIVNHAFLDKGYFAEGDGVSKRQILSKAINLAVNWMKENQSIDVLQKWGPRVPSTFDVDLQTNPISIHEQHFQVKLKRYTGSYNLINFFNAVVKSTENSMRALFKFRGKLRNIEIPEELQKELDTLVRMEYDPEFAKKAEKKKEVHLDFEAISALRTQSDQVREALKVEEEDLPDPIVIQSVQQTQPQEDVVLDDGFSLPASHVHQLQPQPSEPSNHEALQKIAGNLTKQEASMLRQIKEKGGSFPFTERRSGLMQSVNLLAETYLHTPMLVQEGKKIHVAEGMLENLEQMLKLEVQPAQTSAKTSGKKPGNQKSSAAAGTASNKTASVEAGPVDTALAEAGSVDTALADTASGGRSEAGKDQKTPGGFSAHPAVSSSNELSPLESYILGLSDFQKQALGIVLSGNDVDGRLESLAMQNFTMPDLIIDELNMAFEPIMNDVLIDSYDGQTTVLEQYKEQLETLLKGE